MKGKLLVFSVVFLFLGIGIGWFVFRQSPQIISPVGTGKAKERPLLAYAFENLKRTPIVPSSITLGRVIDETENTREQVFYYYAPSTPGVKPSLKVSGVISLPKSSGLYPVIIMFRGFIPEDAYTPGAGTQHVAEVLSRNGYITLAPDFLGFGESDKPSIDTFEARFQTYTAALTLMNSLNGLDAAFAASGEGGLKADTGRVGVWGHSNGGHIALAVMAISGKDFPTVLWAPVSKPFPYSILYYSDEADDRGRAMRKVLADFEESYNADLFSPAEFYSWIKAPVEIDQGNADKAVPSWWTDELVDILKKGKVDVTYNTYPGADHNMLPSAWSSAVENCMAFFKDRLK